MTQLTRRAALRLGGGSALLPLVATTAFADNDMQSHTVIMRDYAFVPQHIEIKTGETITWVNEDDTYHSAWDLNDQFDTGLLALGKTASFTFIRAGTFSYRSRPYGDMRGTITITN